MDQKPSDTYVVDMDDSCICPQMLTISFDKYMISVKIVDEFDSLTSIYGPTNSHDNKHTNCVGLCTGASLLTSKSTLAMHHEL
jgi:hypothetical protein